jgi:hypothetical protein
MRVSSPAHPPVGAPRRPSPYHLEAERSLEADGAGYTSARVGCGRVGAVPLLHFAAAQPSASAQSSVVLASMVHMNPESYGPPVVAGQLEFMFDGVEPLSLEEKIADWLDSQNEETPDTLTAALFLVDNESRRRRANRWFEVRCVQARYDSDSGWLTHGGVEVIWLYDEACRSYINGAYFSALLCAHAACERVLADCLYPYREELDKNWLMWGLGKLIVAAGQHGIIDAEIMDQLDRLNQTRKVSAHYKSFLDSPTSVQRRAISVLEDYPDQDEEEVIDNITRSDALFGLQVASFLVRSNLGLS